MGQPQPGVRIGLPALHLDHVKFGSELERRYEPARHLSHRQPVTHGHRAGTDKALPAGFEQQTLDRPPGRIGAIQYPDRFAVRGTVLEQVAQRRNEGVHATADVLQVDQQYIEALHHRCGRPTNPAVQTEHGHAQLRVLEVIRLDHVVLLVSAQPVLRPESGRQLQVRKRGERIQRVGQICGYRGRVGNEGQSPPRQRSTQGRFLDQSIDAKFHGRASVGPGSARESFTTMQKPSASWKSGFAPG